MTIEHNGEVYILLTDHLKALKEQREEIFKQIEDKFPKEKPMTVFSFVLRGEELELYMRHKGYNECRGEMRDIIKLIQGI